VHNREPVGEPAPAPAGRVARAVRAVRSVGTLLSGRRVAPAALGPAAGDATMAPPPAAGATPEATGGSAPKGATKPTTEVEMTAIVRFIEEMARIPDPKVVELGTRRQASQERTRHSVWVPHAREYVGVDYERGDDVDVVADAHELSKHFAAESVDGVIACSIFEHIKYPWIATAELAKILRVGGLAFIHTHQTFALHAHPRDYWRFSMEGLAALFPVTLGFEVLSCHYQYPCRIVTPDDPLQAQNPSYLNVCLLARKVGPAPEAFVPDFSR
jgi:SAM-dependent methyltransferase